MVNRTGHSSLVRPRPRGPTLASASSQGFHSSGWNHAILNSLDECIAAIEGRIEFRSANAARLQCIVAFSLSTLNLFMRVYVTRRERNNGCQDTAHLGENVMAYTAYSSVRPPNWAGSTAFGTPLSCRWKVLAGRSAGRGVVEDKPMCNHRRFTEFKGRQVPPSLKHQGSLTAPWLPRLPLGATHLSYVCNADASVGLRLHPPLRLDCFAAAGELFQPIINPYPGMIGLRQHNCQGV